MRPLPSAPQTTLAIETAAIRKFAATWLARKYRIERLARFHSARRAARLNFMVTAAMVERAIAPQTDTDDTVARGVALVSGQKAAAGRLGPLIACADGDPQGRAPHDVPLCQARALRRAPHDVPPARQSRPAHARHLAQD